MTNLLYFALTIIVCNCDLGLCPWVCATVCVVNVLVRLYYYVTIPGLNMEDMESFNWRARCITEMWACVVICHELVFLESETVRNHYHNILWLSCYEYNSYIKFNGWKLWQPSCFQSSVKILMHSFRNSGIIDLLFKNEWMYSNLDTG